MIKIGDTVIVVNHSNPEANGYVGKVNRVFSKDTIGAIVLETPRSARSFWPQVGQDIIFGVSSVIKKKREVYTYRQIMDIKNV